MGEAVRYTIDDTERVAPHVRLCHLMLRSALTEGFSALELACPPGEIPTARSERDGSWEWYMAFPPPAYGQIVDYIKRMAGVLPDQPDAVGRILVRLAGRDATITMTVRTSEHGEDEVVLRFGEA